MSTVVLTRKEKPKLLSASLEEKGENRQKLKREILIFVPRECQHNSNRGNYNLASQAKSVCKCVKQRSTELSSNQEQEKRTGLKFCKLDKDDNIFSGFEKHSMSGTVEQNANLSGHRKTEMLKNHIAKANEEYDRMKSKAMILYSWISSLNE